MKANSKLSTVFAVVAMVLTLLCGCRDGRFYDHYEPVCDDGWGRNDTVRFAIPRQAKGDYRVNLGLRINHRYPYRDLSLIVCYKTLPSGHTVSDTVLLHLINEKGQPAGPMGITSAAISRQIKALRLQDGDSLYVTVHHNMRNDQLTGIIDVGLQLSSE